MARTKHAVKIGTISAGTLRPCDLIPALAAELAYLRGPSALRGLGRIHGRMAEWYDSEDAMDVLADLEDRLNAIAPSYTYFGAHPRNGSDFGFWPNLDAIADDVRDGELPSVGPRDSWNEVVLPGYRGLVLEESDHGNLVLWRVRGRRVSEVWSCV